MWMLDTDICIALIKRQPPELIAKLKKHKLGEVAISSDDISAECYGHVRATLESAGTPIGPLDTLIAGHALSISATVVTNNVREFSRVRGLRVQNWLES